MRLIQINNSAETFTATSSGAIATHIWEVCRCALLNNVEPVVITRDSKEAALGGVELLRVSLKPRATKGIFKWAGRIQRRLTGWRDLYQREYTGLVLDKIKAHGMERELFLLHNDPELAVCLKSQFPRARVLHHFHNPVVCARSFQRKFRETVDLVTAVSGYVAAEIHRIYGVRNVGVVHNGVDLQRFSPGDTNQDEPVVVNFLGRTGIEKAPDLLLKAALELSDLHTAFKIQMLGSNHWGRWEADAYQAELFRLVSDLKKIGIEVLQPGHVTRSEIPEFLKRAHVHVLPSRWDEPCALSLLEGMASGLAVVASHTGGTPEVLGHAGRLFQRDSEQELAEHLRLLIENRVLRRELGLSARRQAEEFPWERCWAGFRQLVA